MVRAGLVSVVLMVIAAGCADGNSKGANAEPRMEIVDVFTPGGDGPEYKNYRIPSLCVTGNGTLVGFAEGRRIASDHHKGPIVCKRSYDGGASWGGLQIVAEHGRSSLNNPTPVVVPGSGRILVFYQEFPEDYHSRAIPKEGVKLAESGYEGDKVVRTYVAFSDDDGRTWSKGRDITRQVKRGVPVFANFSGPGVAIVLDKGEHKGRIVVPSCDLMMVGGKRVVRSYVCYSDDGGDSWNVGEYALDAQGGGGSETQVVELADGRLMLDVRAKGSRNLAYSSDGGVNWTELKKQADLPDSGCMGCVIRYELAGGESVLLHSGSTKRINGRRSRGAVYVSRDDGQSWGEHRVYHPGSFDYSSMVRLPNGDVGILAEFEFGVKGKFNDLRFVRFNLAWLFGRE